MQDYKILSACELSGLLAEIRAKLAFGLISYYEATIEAKPIIDEMNNRAADIARTWNKPKCVFTFSKLMR
ncbi:MAG TPA: hypothetical protein VJL60_03080 [Gammaproteobacteria bacterium]|nr:hypothetical protein [Gammaproteobacteria bacterium]